MGMKYRTQPQVYHQADHPMKLRVPEGIKYVEARSYEEIKAALEEGMAVYVESCDGRAFLWKQDGAVLADVFYLSDARPHDFGSLEEAADFAAELCDRTAEAD